MYVKINKHVKDMCKTRSQNGKKNISLKINLFRHYL